MCTARETQECYVKTWIGTEQDRNRNRNGTKLEMVILGWYVIPKFECGTKFRESGSRCEAVMAVLQGWWVPRWTSAGGVTGMWQFGTSWGLSAKSCECYGCNTWCHTISAHYCTRHSHAPTPFPICNSNFSISCISPTCYEWVDCTTWPEVRFQRGFGQCFSLCTAPTYYCGSEYFLVSIHKFGT